MRLVWWFANDNEEPQGRATRTAIDEASDQQTKDAQRMIEPEQIFVRYEGEYYLVLDVRSHKKVRSMIAEMGFERFTKEHCKKWIKEIAQQ